MYPILILRSELVCLVILIFLYFTSRAYRVNIESKSFARLLAFAVIHVVFDIITVITVNNTDSVPSWLNLICHIIFYLSAILFSNEVANYVVNICYPRVSRKLYVAGYAATLLYVLCLPLLEIKYVPDLGTYSSAGSAAIVGYGLAFSFFIMALVIIFLNMDILPTSVKTALIPMMLVLMLSEIAQIIWRSVLFTGGAITIVTVGFFFSLENPVAVFRKKAMTDALTGVRSRSSYEDDIENFDKAFKEHRNEDYLFVFCDINELKSVNSRFGHEEGDNYITVIASAIKCCMKHASTIYRIGGDEFLAFYYQEKEEIVEKELNDLHNECLRESENSAYPISVSAGYACSSANFESLREVVKVADYYMYRDKTKKKRNGSMNNDSAGTKLNLSGLTDKIFDALCASNETSYPYITNMDTNVTRIAPGWKDYFGLDSEFYYDFNSVWAERIHPDYVDNFLEDIAAVVNDHKKFHRFDYPAKRADGNYVRVSCQGSIFCDAGSGITYFAGFMVNCESAWNAESDTD